MISKMTAAMSIETRREKPPAGAAVVELEESILQDGQIDTRVIHR